MIRSIESLHRLPQSPIAARWTVRVAGAAVVVLLAKVLVLAVSAPQLPATAADGPAPEAAYAAREPLAGWHLFGIPGAGDALAATTLALTLRGIVGSNVAGLATAVIADQGRTDAAYHVGDALPGGGVLESIHADHVVIRNGGHRESLAFGDQRDPDAAASAAATAGPGGVAPVAPATTSPVVAGTPAIATAGAPLVPAVGAAQLAGQANLLPVVENGQVVGARIATPDVALLERIGLRRDDVVTSVDGRAIDGPGASQALEASLSNGAAVLVVRRDGREQTVQIGGGAR